MAGVESVFGAGVGVIPEWQFRPLAMILRAGLERLTAREGTVPVHAAVLRTVAAMSACAQGSERAALSSAHGVGDAASSGAPSPVVEMSTAQVACRLQTSVATVGRLAHQGVAGRKVAGRYRFGEVDLDLLRPHIAVDIAGTGSPSSAERTAP